MTAPPFDPQAAVSYGRFIQAADTMYVHAGQNDQRPPPSPDFPAGYELIAWVQMQDFILDSTDPVFYGFVAHSTSEPGQAVLAIRGTQGGVEWSDDINSLGMTPFKVRNCGNVGLGFERIYDTLELIERTPAAPSGVAPRSLKNIGSFSAQMATLLHDRAQAAASELKLAAPSSIAIAGHSLGAALAILCAAENALVHKIHNPGLCTFASPKIGDQDFVNAFNELALTSWRVVNKQDIVPHLPPGLFYQHVQTEVWFDSDDKIQPTFSCWHALATYLSLIDPELAPDLQCQLPKPARSSFMGA
jgi:hypothetical protein